MYRLRITLSGLCSSLPRHRVSKRSNILICIYCDVPLFIQQGKHLSLFPLFFYAICSNSLSCTQKKHRLVLVLKQLVLTKRTKVGRLKYVMKIKKKNEHANLTELFISLFIFLFLRFDLLRPFLLVSQNEL